MPRLGPRAPAVLLVTAAACLAPPAALAQAQVPSRSAGSTATAAAPGVALPGRFVVRGAPLARRGKVVAGHTVSIYARPAAVVLDGCRSRAARVRVRRRTASVSVLARCKGIRGKIRLSATLRGKTLRGTAGRRRFAARLRPPGGKLLGGRPAARALRALRSVATLRPHAATEISRARSGAEVPRTELVLRLRPNATVGQVNAALRAAGGRIAGSVPDLPRLVVAIPDPGSLGVLDALLAALSRRPGIDEAMRAEMADGQELPPGFATPLPGARGAELSHLLAMRAPAAWNARAAIQTSARPLVIVVDEFGNGRLSAQVDAAVNPSSLLTGNPNPHGYHVVGIMAAKLANNGSAAGRVTGVFPARARLKVVDVVGTSLDYAAIRALDAIRGQSGRIVLNTSLGHNPATIERYARKEGSDWAGWIRTGGFGGRLFHATSAGNDAVSAGLNGYFASSAVRTDLVDATGAPLAPLDQTLVVESLLDTGAPDYQAGCLSLSTNRGGNIAAVGDNVFSLTLGNSAGNISGTSQAAPQVAALGEYIWSIAPDLSAPQVAAAIRATAAQPLSSGPPCNTDVASAPRLDAYAAVLSLDQPAPLTPASAPVRLAILDRDGNGAFTHTDLQAFVSELPADSFDKSWGRSDLNGDGFAGGTHRAPLDLNPVGSARAGAATLGGVTQTIEGVHIDLDETAVTDTEALCFYAYSGLYTGSEAARRTALNPAQRCGAVAEDASGSFEGVARDCDTNTDGSPSCGDDAEALGLLQVTASGFTFYVQAAANGAIDPATCAVPGQDANNCYKATGSSTSSPFTGIARKSREATQMPFQATLSGDRLTGRIDEDTTPGDPIWIEFELTRVP